MPFSRNLPMSRWSEASPEKSGAILHLTTVDDVPLAVELPAAVLADLVEQLQQVLKRLRGREQRAAPPLPQTEHWERSQRIFDLLL